MPHAYTEDQQAPRILTRPLPSGEEVEQPAIGLFAELGWTTVSALEETFGATGTLLRETKGEVEGLTYGPVVTGNMEIRNLVQP